METISNQRQALRWVALGTDRKRPPNTTVRFVSPWLAVEVLPDDDRSTYRFCSPDAPPSEQV